MAARDVEITEGLDELGTEVSARAGAEVGARAFDVAGGAGSVTVTYEVTVSGGLTGVSSAPAHAVSAIAHPVTAHTMVNRDFLPDPRRMRT